MTDKIVYPYSTQHDDLVYVYTVKCLLVKFINTSITSQLLFMLVARTLKIYSQQILSIKYSAMLLAILTRRCIRSLEIIHLII